MFGAGGGTVSYKEIEETDVILLWGSNAREAHPIFFHHLMQGLHNGARMYAVDPRRTSSAKFADLWVGLELGSDVALANTVANYIVSNDLHNKDFIAHSTTGFDAYVESLAELHAGARRRTHRRTRRGHRRDGRGLRHRRQGPDPVDAGNHRAPQRASTTCWSLCNLALLTGHVGRWGSGLVPLRGQNNVQGGGDMGALPNKLPGFQNVTDPDHRAKFEAVWGRPIPPDDGIHLTLMFEAMERGEITAAYVIGENPADSEADIAHARKLLEGSRPAGGPGHLPHPHRRTGRRGAAGIGRLGRVRWHRHLVRAPCTAGSGCGLTAGRGPARSRHPRATWPIAWAIQSGATPPRKICGTNSGRCRRCTQA